MAPIQEDDDIVGYGPPGSIFYFRIFKSEVQARPVFDEANRTVVGVKHRLQVTGYILPDDGDDTTDDVWQEQMRRRLTPAGQMLVYQSSGYGELIVNDPLGGPRDLAWGPHPGPLTFRPIGFNKVSYFDWSVETTIPECPNALYERGLAAVNYAENRSISDIGVTTITITGYAEIPVTRFFGSREVRDHIDEYKVKLTPRVPLGYRKVREEWRCSLDKRRADFTYVYEQMPTALPPKVVAAPLRHRLRNSQPNVGIAWEGVISGPVTMSPGVPRNGAYGVFLTIAHDRLQRLRNNQPLPPGAIQPQNFLQLGQLPANQNNRLLLVRNFEVDEEMTGWTTFFSLTYTIVNPGTPEDLFRAAGMWTPLPATDFRRWNKSLEPLANHPHGAAQFRFRSQDDAIIDLCIRENQPLESLGEQREVVVFEGRQIVLPQFRQGGVRGVRERRPRVSPEKSWLMYDTYLVYTEAETEGRFARHKPMGGSTSDLGSGLIDASGDTAARAGGRISGALPSVNPTVPDNVHEVETPSPRIYLVGRAARLGYQIPAPNLESVGGRTARRTRIMHLQQGHQRYIEDIVYTLEWMIEYMLDAPPEGNLPILANPFLGIDGQD